MKIARKWDTMSHDQQLAYLKKHRKSKLRPTNNDVENIVELKKTLKTHGFNKHIEGKEYKVKAELFQWIDKLEKLGFQDISIEPSDGQWLFKKDDVTVNIKFGKGKMKYYATLDIEYLTSKVANDHFLLIQNEFIKYAIMSNKKKTLADAIELLQNFENAENPRSILQQAVNIVSLQGIKPADIQLAADIYENNPDQAKKFIYGPSGRGSGLGAIKDLQIIKEKKK